MDTIRKFITMVLTLFFVLLLTNQDLIVYSMQNTISVSGDSANMLTIQVTDPNIGRVVTSNTTGKYYVSFSEAYNAVMDHWAQHLYW
ncbi:MAG: hypothetical protein ACK5JH_10980 [Anaerocolumna sp.]